MRKRLYNAGHPTWPSAKHMSATRCASKVRHESWASAEQHLLELVAMEHQMGSPELAQGLVSYQCSHCGAWHVGHGIGASPQFQARLAERRATRRASGNGVATND